MQHLRELITADPAEEAAEGTQPKPPPPIQCRRFKDVPPPLRCQRTLPDTKPGGFPRKHGFFISVTSGSFSELPPSTPTLPGQSRATPK
jgi:hypothetical protein